MSLTLRLIFRFPKSTVSKLSHTSIPKIKNISSMSEDEYYTMQSVKHAYGSDPYTSNDLVTESGREIFQKMAIEENDYLTQQAIKHASCFSK